MRSKCCAAAWIGVTVLSPVLVAQQRDLHVRPDPGRRLALVFGNDDYQHAPRLRNAANDADDLARTLVELGFEVDRVTNADLRRMETAIDGFVAKLRAGDVAFFHFSGHGIQVEGENYLIPVDFRLSDEPSVKYDAYSASKLHDRLAGSGSRLNIVVLDACRNNGFRRTRSGSAGLAAMHAAEGSFVAFSTSPGRTADDNPAGDNGLFTSYLLGALRQPGLDLDDVFNHVREKVYQASGRRQLPWSSSSVIGEFHFRPAVAEASQQPSGEASLAVELAYWNSIKDSANPAVFAAYLTDHPEGSFATLAKIKLEELQGRASGAPGPAASVEKPAPQPGGPSPAAVKAVPHIETARVGPGRVSGASAPPIVEPPGAPQPGTVTLNTNTGLKYVWIPPGAFRMGCAVAGRCEDDEKPVHVVTLTRGFWMMQTEATVDAFERFTQATARPMPPAPGFNSGWRKPNHPVVGTTWAEAQAFCDWAGGRLPTEAEWEYAARGGEPQSSDSEVNAVAWHAKISDRRTHEVGSKAPNDWGLFDMLGNAAEWSGDWYVESYGSGPRTDPRGPRTGRARVLRGGSWQSDPKELRPSGRSPLLPGMRNRDVGFRCMRRGISLTR